MTTTEEQRRRREALSPQGSSSWYRIDVQNKTDGPSTAKVYLYDEIGMWGTSAQSFKDELEALDVEQLDVHINSPGGEVWDGVTILNTLRNHPARVTTIVDGVAASSASFIAMGGDEVVMSRNSELMIHDAWGMAVGNAGDLRDLADRLDAHSNNIASIYAERTGGTVEEWRDFMRAETWYSADEAVAAGLADRVSRPDKKAADATSSKNRFDLSIFNYAGRAAAPAPINTPSASAGDQRKETAVGDPGPDLNTDGQLAEQSVTAGTGADLTVVSTGVQPAANPESPTVPATPDVAVQSVSVPPAATVAGTATSKEGAGMNLDPAKLRESFGLNPNASDEEVRAAVVASGFASMTPIGAGAPSVAQGNPIARPTENDPTVVTVDSSILDQLRMDAAAGVEAFQKLVRQERDRTIANAINEGKFAVARREHWEKAWDRDPEGTKQAIAGLSKGLIPTTPLGYLTNQTEGKGADDQLYAELYGTDPNGL
jgi:ATP-dependent Clp endopeptidase proteolytic subunit ClpP